jgi:hypothetical protein
MVFVPGFLGDTIGSKELIGRLGEGIDLPAATPWGRDNWRIVTSQNFDTVRKLNRSDLLILLRAQAVAVGTRTSAVQKHPRNVRIDDAKDVRTPQNFLFPPYLVSIFLFGISVYCLHFSAPASVFAIAGSMANAHNVPPQSPGANRSTILKARIFLTDPNMDQAQIAVINTTWDFVRNATQRRGAAHRST